MDQHLWKVLKVVYYLLISYFTYLMVLITWQYIPLNFDVAFLRLKQTEIGIPYYQYAFFSHVYCSIIVLLAGILQFSSLVRQRFPKVHKNLGKLYVLLVLLIASPSGFIMALHANGGVFSKISFSLQAILWFFFTWQAYRFAKNGIWDRHRKFMFRSYALTLSAISLRLFKWIIVTTLEWPPMDTYKIVAWLGWLVNIFLVEIYLIKSKSPSAN